jgi:hypothetical protein
MFRARLAGLLLSAGLCGCVTYHCPPGGPFCDSGFGPAPVSMMGAGCDCMGGGGIAPPLAGAEGPLLEGNPGVPIGPPMNGNGFTLPPGRLRPQPLAQPMPTPP